MKDISFVFVFNKQFKTSLRGKYKRVTVSKVVNIARTGSVYSS